MGGLEPQRYEDVRVFARALLDSRDLDPIYDVLRAFYAQQGIDGERALWFTTLYLAFYNMPSALRAYHVVPGPALLPDWLAGLPTAVERRNLRGGKVRRNIASYLGIVRHAGSQAAFLTAGWTPDDPHANFLRFWEQAQQPWGNGRWAAFKWADLLKNVHGFPLAAPDMRMAQCSGPKEGLQFLYGTTTEHVPTLDRLGAELREQLARDGLVLDWEQLETVLCNYKSLAKGAYYVGHDIDELQERISASVLAPDEQAPLWRARHAALPLAYLGEAGGWHGIQKSRMRAYADAGAILVRP